MSNKKIQKPDRISTYYKCEWIPLTLVTISGIIYNVGMIAGPYFEGRMVQKLFDIMSGTAVVASMIRLVLLYIGVIIFVQGMRSVKRFYVRRMANNMNRNMRRVIYHNLIHRKVAEIQKDSTGSVVTKVIQDVDACVEGVRKFTTEVFDTGVVLVVYIVMLIVYDWRLALISCIFPPIAYIVAERLKKLIYMYHKKYKKSTEKLNNITYDRLSGAILYRLYGREEQMNQNYDQMLHEYEDAAVKANIWENAMQPIYLVISSISVIFIIYFGAKNVVGTGWSVWNIAAFTTFLSCFTKMATKSSKAAKLFNAVQKAKVSWKRIKPFMAEQQVEVTQEEQQVQEDQAEPHGQEVQEQDAKQNQNDVMTVSLQNVSFSYPDGKQILDSINLTAHTGEIIGVTGPVGVGKSTFGKLFLSEYPYQGSICLNGMELSLISETDRNSIITYMGHQPELISGSITDNICLGDDLDSNKWLKAVCMDKEVNEMPKQSDTQVGNGGVRLSGGQQARIALARTLSHGKDILILDDPLSAVDKVTEAQLMEYLHVYAKDKVIFLITHRLTHFPQLSKVVWIQDHKAMVAKHDDLMKQNEEYRHLYQMQIGGKDYDA